MKKKGSCSDYTDQRNRELLRAMSEVVRDGHSTRVMDHAVQRPCSRFWVSEDRATVVMRSHLIDGKPLSAKMQPNKRAMYEEIAGRIRCLKANNPSITMRQAVRDVIYSPAPCFYMTADGGAATIKKSRKKWIRETEEKLKYLL